MKRIWGHIVSLCVAGMAVSAILPACATNDQTIFIRQAMAPSATRVNGACTYLADPQAPALLGAKLDLGLVDSYFVVLLVANQLTPRGDQANNRAESNRAHINGGIIRVTEPDGTLIREFTSTSVGFADPGQNSSPGYTLAGMVAFDALTKAAILGTPPGLPNRAVQKTILLNIKAFGKTLGGEDLESGEFQLPMQVCNGCLVDFTTGQDNDAKVKPNCSLKPMTGVTTTIVNPCFLGQDESVKCETCIGRLAVCDPKNP